MARADGRANDALRPVRITTDFVKFAEGSVLIECGDTKVLCCASVEDRVPPHGGRDASQGVQADTGRY